MTAFPPPEHQSLSSLLIQLWGQLSHRRHTQLGTALVLMIVCSLAEVLSLASVLPFLAVLTNPDGFLRQPLVKQWAPFLGITNAHDLLLPFTLCFAAASISSGAIRLFTLWLNARLASAIGSDISCEVYRRTLYQPYSVQVTRNSSFLIASINGDVSSVISQVLNPLLQLCSSILIILALSCTLLAFNWLIALGAGLFIALLYAAAMTVSFRPLQQLSHKQVVLNRQLIQTLQEGLGSIRDVLLDGSQAFYITRYRQADELFRRGLAKSTFLSSYPRLVMEPAGMAFLASVGYFLVLQDGMTQALPLIGLLSLGAQRMLPMAQKVYEGWALTRNSKQSLVNVLALLTQPLPADAMLQQPNPLTFSRTIRLEGVCFRYAPALPDVIHGLDLEIRLGERLGLIGSTGSGKSTLVDLLMGLLEPTEGSIFVDDQYLHHHTRQIAAWRAAIAHVPQSIYLADTSIAENIAFGIPKEQIDLDRLYQAADQAQISAFIESTSNGYETFVGERGVRLSGGQRQRIGIARALYKRAKVLVLDEATAALDNSTEQAVMEAVEGLNKDLTVLIVAHRLSTIAACDRVIQLCKGSIIADGPPGPVLCLNES